MNIENSNPGARPSEKTPGKEIGPGPGKESVPPAGGGDAPPRRRGGAFFIFLAVLLSLAAAALSAWTWWQMQQAANEPSEDVQAELARLSSAQSALSRNVEQMAGSLEDVAAKDPGGAIERVNQEVQADRNRLAALDRTVAEQVAINRSLQAATETMQARLRAAEAAVSGLSASERDAGEDLNLAEVDYLLRLANERLQLFSDPQAADRALQMADSQLAAMDSPVHIGVRQEIAAARRALDAVEKPDLVEIASGLDAVQARIPELAFRTETPAPADPAAEDDSGWWSSLKSTFSSLVTVRRSSVDENARITLEDQDFIRQRVWLQLEMARLALMRQDEGAFGRALERAADTLDTWFDPMDESTARAIENVERLAGTPIRVEMPDITTPWNLLQALRAAGTTAPVEVVQPAEPQQSAEPEQPVESDGGSGAG